MARCYRRDLESRTQHRIPRITTRSKRGSADVPKNAIWLHFADQLAANHLHSTCDTPTRSHLRDTSYWTVELHLHDGRRSHDTLDMIEALRVFGESGIDIQVYGNDHVLLPAESAPPGTPDAAMASADAHRPEARAVDQR